MADFKKIFLDYLNENHIHYTDHSEFAVRIPYSGQNLKTIPMFVSFDRQGGAIANIKCFEIASFKGKEEKGLRLCNELHNKYRWLKFYLDEDLDLIACLDTYFDERTCGFFCLDLVARSVSIIDEIYPQIANAVWA